MSIKKILYVNIMDDYMGVGSPRTNVSRFRALAAMPGLDVKAFDSRSTFGESQWQQRLNRRFYSGKSVRRANSALIEAVRETNPDYVIVDSDIWIYPSTLKTIKQHVGALVYYGTDDALAIPSYRWLHRLGIKYFDLYLTTNRFNVREMHDRYGVPAIRVGMGYDRDYYTKSVLDSRASGATGTPIIFVGHWEPHTENFINSLIDAGHSVSLHGARWQKAKNPALRGTLPLPGQNYIESIGNASIALCFLSKENRNESTGRSYEIPGIGTFMLAQRTDEHEYIFGDGVGAGLFSSQKELVEKAAYYLDHSSERRQIADKGRSLCQELGLSWQEHMQREWPIIARILQQGIDALTDADDFPFWQGFRRGEALRPESHDKA
jgi:spore maturation protein CgeB